MTIRWILQVARFHRPFTNKPPKISTILVGGRTFSTKNQAKERIVYLSLSRNIFENLAFEEWVYEKTDLTNTDVLLMWRNEPCVVIGRHQNPWVETNVPLLERELVCLARRSSGGGAVYHDQGNLNLSFLKDRSRYDRKENLSVVVNALTSKWDVDLSINKRDDIVLDGVHKVSGSAAKLARDKSYHHFTLLHSVDQSQLSRMLSSPLRGDNNIEDNVSVDSKSTKSVPSPIQNLQARAPSMTFDQLVDAIAAQFLEDTSLISHTQIIANPIDDQLFPGVSEMCQRLQSWDWMYGKTPKFSIKVDIDENNTRNGSVRDVVVTSEKGCLSSFVITLNNGTVIDIAYVMNFKGIQMKRENLNFLTRSDFLSSKSFSDAYPGLDVKSILSNMQQCIPRIFNFL